MWCIKNQLISLQIKKPLVKLLKLLIFTLLHLIIFFPASGKGYTDPTRKSIKAYRILSSIKIDGFTEDSAWHSIPSISDFRQYQPIFDTTPSFATEVKIAYDDYSIYIVAVMHDPNPDSIFKQLALRDSEYINADLFKIEFDTYNNQIDAYSFVVTASGTQLDSRETDETYDGVWESKTRITESGWIAEMRIPYSALRFARIESQSWGIQISRSIRRYRETNQWALESLEATNDLPYWGILNGMKDIQPPIRLSISPYAVVHAEHFPSSTTENDLSTSLSGGMDLKYGIDESFTLDMSLLPDFSQVQSDDKVKNLSAFETVYEENRPFFKEAVDLFKNGNIFYSRRIGRTPELFHAVSDSLSDGEELIKNPSKQRLLNSTKVSGRTKYGLAIGFLNAVSANTYALVRKEDNEDREILTDPATNYNILVFDQALRNNSNIFIINTNVIRANNFSDANVIASGATLNNRSNTYRLQLSGGMSMISNTHNKFDVSASNAKGYKYNLAAQKIKGNFQWSVSRNMMDINFNANHLGLTLYNNYNENIASVSYNLYKPFWKFRNLSNQLQIYNQNNNTTGKNQKTSLQYKSNFTTLRYLSFWTNLSYRFIEGYDYYEPRTADRYYVLPKTASGFIGFSTDYRKAISLDGSLSGYKAGHSSIYGYGIELMPRFQFSDKLFLFLSAERIINKHDEGYVQKLNNQIIFGARDIKTIVTSLGGNYLFSNDISLSLSARHYWSAGKYRDYFNLENNGRLTKLTDYNENHDFNFTSFLVDMVFTWVFAPGSSMNLVWKNEISNEKDRVYGTYFRNFSESFSEPQLNSLSFKILYYLDYQNVTKKKNKR